MNWGGSSRGMIEFLKKELVPFARDHPDTEFTVEMKKARHPTVFAEYRSGPCVGGGFDKAIGVKNMSCQEILAVAKKLRDSSGRKIKQIDKPILQCSGLSVQGRWTAALPYQSLYWDVEHVWKAI